MRKTTNLSEIKSLARTLVYLDIQETELGEIVVKHPYTDSAFVVIQDDIEPHGRFVNLLKDKEGLEKWRQSLIARIEKSDLLSIYAMITKPYILAFIKLVKSYLSKEDLTRIFGNAWTRLEFITSNGIFTTNQLVGIFKQCEPSILMDKEELKVIEGFDDTITIYRGTRNGSKKTRGMSWTTDIEIARWFSNRFSSNGKPGNVYQAEIDKENILAYFEGRNEQEVVVDPKGLRGVQKIV